MEGILYGVGVGPGDPELLTLKAVRTISSSPVIAVPASDYRSSVAYKIVAQEINDLDEKEILAIDMPMTKDKVQLKASHDKGSQLVMEQLKKGKNVAFLTLGDPTVYSTYLYIHRQVEAAGFQTKIISGITSFCAVAARLNDGLVEKSESLHIIPASYPVDEALKLPGTKVLMKSGRKIGQVRQKLIDSNLNVRMIENCGMDNERIFNSAREIPEQTGYYALIIAKEDV